MDLSLTKLNDVSAAPVQTCDEFPLVSLRKLFLRIRIYYCLKFASRDFSFCKRKLKNSKYITLNLKFRTYKKINNKLRQQRSFNATVAPSTYSKILNNNLPWNVSI